MSMPDKKFPVIWTAFIIVVLGAFSIIESLAIRYDGTTLSRYVYELNRDWPLLEGVICLVIGVLISHFFWHWNPPGSDNEG